MDALSEQVKVSSALDYVSGSADREGAALDMAGYDGVLMLVKFAAIAAGAATSIKAQTDAASAFASAQDVAGSSQSIADDDDNQIFMIDVLHPPERFVRLYVDKDAANATAESAIYIQYRARELPCDNNVDDLITTELLVAPVNGTA